MCAAGHGWAGLGRVVAAASATQLVKWRASWGLPAGPVATLPITDVVPALEALVTVAPVDAEMRELHRRAARRRGLG